MLVILIGSSRILRSYHDFMQLLAGTDTNLRHLTSGKHCFCKIRNLKGRDLTDEGFPTGCFLKSLDHKLYALRQTDPETGHAVISNRQLVTAIFNDVMEKRNNGATASCHISITHDGKINVLGTGIRIRCNKQLIRNQLRTTIKVHRVHRLIGR